MTKKMEKHTVCVGNPQTALPAPLELWGGLECSLVRVGDAYHDQFLIGGHNRRADTDLVRIAELGIRTLRYPVSWERICPDGDLSRADWSWTDARMEKLRALGMRVIAGLVHHGSGPRDNSMADPVFPERLAEFARVAAERYPWVTDWTPVNEPLTTARFSGLYGHWYPHGYDEETFIRCLFAEVRGTVLAMRAIREVIPGARLVQTEDLGKVYSTPALVDQAEFENQRRWLSLDLLCGHVLPGGLGDRMWGHLRWVGVSEEQLRLFAEETCPPDILGINHYITSERFLDERRYRYPPHTYGSNGRQDYADIEAVRVLEGGCAGAGELLREAWGRYQRPLAITEAHLGCTPEEQIRWLTDVWREAEWARSEGADVRGVTIWSLFGAWDWNSLLTQKRDSYEPGVFDVRGKPEPRPTALAAVCRALAAGKEPAHPVLDTPGWWRRSCRLLYPPVEGVPHPRSCPPQAASHGGGKRPLLITGARGLLGEALVRICEERGIACVPFAGRSELDISRRNDVEEALDEHKPWAIVNAAGFTSVTAAEAEPLDCLRANTVGPAALAHACARRGINLLQFSSALVFDGSKAPEPYVESDERCPSGAYARSKARMEEAVTSEKTGRTLIVRTSALFGPWDERNFLMQALVALAMGHTVHAASDEFLTPAYLPDLAGRALDLLIDGAEGIWHLAHPEPVSRAEIIRRAAEMAGISTSGLRALPLAEMSGGLPWSAWAVLGSERMTTPLLPPLDSALGHFVTHSPTVDTAKRVAQIRHESNRLLENREVLRW